MGVGQRIDTREIHMRVIDGLQLVMQRLRLCKKSSHIRNIRQRRVRPPVIALLVRQIDSLCLVRQERVLVENRIFPHAERLQFLAGHQLHRACGRLGRKKAPAGDGPQEALFPFLLRRERAGRTRKRCKTRIRLAVERAIARLQKLDGAALLLQRNTVIELPQIEIQSRPARRPRA